MGSRFRRDRLPDPAAYFAKEGLTFQGTGEWRTTTCPFHSDSHPSLRVRLESGSFCCMTCAARGGDIVDVHMKRHGTTFKKTARALGAWED
jgi:DNA primase